MVLALLVLADLFKPGRRPHRPLYRRGGHAARGPHASAGPATLPGGPGSGEPLGVLAERVERGSFFQALLFVVAAVAAVALLVGYRTWVASVVVWILLLSIQHRNPLVLGSGDDLLRMLLFWGMSLPLGAVWSVDRAVEREAGALRWSTMRYFSLATVALFMR